MKKTSVLLILIVLEFAPPSLPLLLAEPEHPKSFVTGESLPITSIRRTELVPGPLPDRVRYRIANDSEVNSLADRLTERLQRGDTALYSEHVLVQPGAWACLKGTVSLDVKDAAYLSMIDPNQLKKAGIKGGLPGRVFRTPRAIAVLSAEVARLLASDGGYVVRALKTQEMAKWWIYIGFDIEEPIYVVESKEGHYRFIISLVKEKIFILDELGALPGKG